MTSSKMYKLVNQFNEKEPKEIELIYRPWEKPEDRIFIEPADFAANKFMVGNKGIYCRTIYAPGFTDEQVLEACLQCFDSRRRPQSGHLIDETLTLIL